MQSRLVTPHDKVETVPSQCGKDRWRKYNPKQWSNHQVKSMGTLSRNLCDPNPFTIRKLCSLDSSQDAECGTQETPISLKIVEPNKIADGKIIS